MTPNKWVAVVFSLWAVVISYRYVNTTVQGFRTPLNIGNDVEWLAVWLATAIVMIVLAATVKRAVAIVFSILAAAGLIILVLSGTLIAAIAACAILATAHFLGRRFLLFFDVEPHDAAVTIPLGLIVPALGGFVLAALHVLTPLWIALLLSCLAVAAVYDRRLFPRDRPPRHL